MCLELPVLMWDKTESRFEFHEAIVWCFQPVASEYHKKKLLVGATVSCWGNRALAFYPSPAPWQVHKALSIHMRDQALKRFCRRDKEKGITRTVARGIHFVRCIGCLLYNSSLSLGWPLLTAAGRSSVGNTFFWLLVLLVLPTLLLACSWLIKVCAGLEFAAKEQQKRCKDCNKLVFSLRANLLLRRESSWSNFLAMKGPTPSSCMASWPVFSGSGYLRNEVNACPSQSPIRITFIFHAMPPQNDQVGALMWVWHRPWYNSGGALHDPVLSLHMPAPPADIPSKDWQALWQRVDSPSWHTLNRFAMQHIWRMKKRFVYDRGGDCWAKWRQKGRLPPPHCLYCFVGNKGKKPGSKKWEGSERWVCDASKIRVAVCPESISCSLAQTPGLLFTMKAKSPARPINLARLSIARRMAPDISLTSLASSFIFNKSAVVRGMKRNWPGQTTSDGWCALKAFIMSTFSTHGSISNLSFSLRALISFSFSEPKLSSKHLKELWSGALTISTHPCCWVVVVVVVVALLCLSASAQLFGIAKKKRLLLTMCVCVHLPKKKKKGWGFKLCWLSEWRQLAFDLHEMT